MKTAQLVKRSIALAPTSGTATVAGVVDCLGADYATIEVALSAQVNTNAAPVVVKIQESDTNEATAFADINTNTLSKSIDLTASAQVAAFHVNMNGTRKRYLRLFATPGTHTTNSVVTLVGIANICSEIGPSGTTGQADVVAIG